MWPSEMQATGEGIHSLEEKGAQVPTLDDDTQYSGAWVTTISILKISISLPFPDCHVKVVGKED